MKVIKGQNMILRYNVSKINKMLKKHELNDKLIDLKEAADTINFNNYMSRLGLNEEPLKWALEGQQSDNYYEFIYYILEMLRMGILEVEK